MPSAANFKLDTKGKYLGLWIGPGAGETSFEMPCKKYIARCRSLKAKQAPLMAVIRLYNTENVTVFSHVAQVLCLPKSVMEIEKVRLAALLSLPFNAWTGRAMWNLKQGGFPMEFMHLSSVALAARMRTAQRTIPCWSTVKVAIEEARDSIEARLDYPFKAWFNEGVVFGLETAVLDGSGCGLDLRVWPYGEEAKLQRALYKDLKEKACPAGALRGFLRDRLLHWFPREQADDLAPVAVRALLSLQRSGSPELQAALLRTWANGWCTSTRFGDRAQPCLFGCRGVDAIDHVRHYAECDRAWAFTSHRFRGMLPRGSLVAFFGLDEAESKDQLLIRAMHVAAIWGAHNFYRYLQGDRNRAAVQAAVRSRWLSIVRRNERLAKAVRRIAQSRPMHR